MRFGQLGQGGRPRARPSSLTDPRFLRTIDRLLNKNIRVRKHAAAAA